MRFHLSHIFPDARFHGLNGYLEVIETIRWGLEALGHQVTVAKNTAETGAVNIIFGYQMLNEAAVRALPSGTIIYNLEQVAHAAPGQMPPIAEYAAGHLRIWDYSPRNLPVWRSLHPGCQPRLVPIGYAPCLTRIARREEDIDVLFYGLPSDARLGVFRDICVAGLRAVFACGIYGRARDELIARSKIVLNLNLYAGKIFEIVRVSYLLANARAVVANAYAGIEVEPDLREALLFAPVDQIVATCARLAQDDAARLALGQRGLEVMKRRDIRQILSSALA